MTIWSHQSTYQHAFRRWDGQGFWEARENHTGMCRTWEPLHWQYRCSGFPTMLSVSYYWMNWLKKITQCSSLTDLVGVITVYLLSTGTEKPFTAERWWWLYQAFQAGSTYGAAHWFEARYHKCSVHMFSLASGHLCVSFSMTQIHPRRETPTSLYIFTSTQTLPVDLQINNLSLFQSLSLYWINKYPSFPHSNLRANAL